MIGTTGLELQQEMELINRYTKKTVSAEEVYRFEIVLCDNEVDRDGEAFTEETLVELSKLFLGKTGIFDHDPSGKNQTARIYDAVVVTLPGKETQRKTPYQQLKAKAYMVKTKGNEDLILEIEAGIKKEVSVGCKVEQRLCSICRTDWNQGHCEHRLGKKYHGKLCCGELHHATDAYEWSFVAVPAQKNAGVTKEYQIGMGKDGMAVLETVKKKLCLAEESTDVVLTGAEADLLRREMEDLKKKAALGEDFLCSKQKKVERLIFLAEGELPAKKVASVVKKMDLEELEAYESYYEKKLALFDYRESDPEKKGVVQLAAQKKETGPLKDNDVFRI